MVEKSIDSVQDGEVLARPVTDDSGAVLVHEGVEVTRTLVRVLQRRGVKTLEIRTAGDQQEAEALRNNPLLVTDDKVVRQKLENMQERLVIAFSPHVEDVTMAVLYKSVLDYLTNKYASMSDTFETES